MYLVISGKVSVSDILAFMALLSRSNFMLDFYILGLCPVYLTFFWELENLICNFYINLSFLLRFPSLRIMLLTNHGFVSSIYQYLLIVLLPFHLLLIEILSKGAFGSVFYPLKYIVKFFVFA